MVRLSIFIATITVALSSQSLASTYYVAKWGDNDNDGSFENPWLTIGKAASVMVAGDTVFIREGIYKEGVNPANSGVPGNPIVYKFFNNEEVVIEGYEEITAWVQDSGNRYRATVNFVPAPRFTTSRDPAGNLGGLVLQDGAKMRYAMSPSPTEVDSEGEYYMNDSSSPPYTMYVYVRDLGRGYDPNNYVMQVGRYRKLFDLDGGEDYIHVEGIILRGANDNAIHSIGSNHCVFIDLKLYSNFITGIYLTANSRDNIIEGCVFWDNGHGGIELKGAHFNTIKKNIFPKRDMGNGYGGNSAHMWLGPLSDYANDNVIENNVMLDTGADEGRNFAAMGILGYRNIIRHNSVWNTGVFHAIGLFDGGDNIVVNNAVSASQVTIWVLSGAVEDGGNLVQYNDLYSWRNEEKFGWGNVLYDSLADWEAVSGQTNNIDSDPLFVDPDNDNLKLQQGSECIDGGTDVNGSDEDYEGNPRPEGNGYDIGAFEYKESGVEDKKGDINGDGQVDVLDVVRAVNIILEIDLPPTEYELWAADCNGDELINILDVVGIVNVILGTGSCTP